MTSAIKQAPHKEGEKFEQGPSICGGGDESGPCVAPQNMLAARPTDTTSLFPHREAYTRGLPGPCGGRAKRSLGSVGNAQAVPQFPPSPQTSFTRVFGWSA